MKPGWKTTEFWLTVLAMVGAYLPGDEFPSKIVMAILAGAAVFGYNVSRGLVKTRGTEIDLISDDAK